MADMRLSIADFGIDLINSSNYPVALEQGYLPFCSEEGLAPASVSVNAYSGISDEQKILESQIYAADFEGNRLWKIGRVDAGLRFHVFNSEAPHQLQQVAELNEDLNVWNIYSEPVMEAGEKKIFPLLYPMGPLVMYYLAAKFDAIMIHGSGISDNGDAHIFTGVSGQGKTTMAKLWFDAGAEVLNDDRLIIRKENNGYRVYNTPMFYADKSRSAKLAAIHSIYHAPSNSLTKLNGIEAVSAVMPNLIQHGYSSDLISHHLNFVSEMIGKIPVYKLGFKPDQGIVQKVKNTRFERA
ncbi:hypothetical protein ACFLR1_01255 [Bacteroidota bacterium]